MANTHYGEIGDVWKRLPLAEVLHIEAPTAYWQSHAGPADYALTHSPTRDYGVFHLIEQAAFDAGSGGLDGKASARSQGGGPPHPRYGQRDSLAVRRDQTSSEDVGSL